MHDIFNRLSSSNTNSKWQLQNATNSRTIPQQYPYQESSILQQNLNEVQGNKMLKKYNEYMSSQNQIISKILLKHDIQKNSKNKQNLYMKPNLEEQIINNLRDQSNQFIRNLLNQLTEVYSKLRTLKLGSQQKIYLLENQLHIQRQISSKIQSQCHQQCQQKCKQSQKYLIMLENQLQSTTEKYQTKLTTFLNQVQKKQNEILVLTQQKKQLQIKLQQTCCILRLEQERINQKNKQYKGMELLVFQYQSTLEEKQNRLASMQMVIDDYKRQVGRLEDYNKDLQFELDRVQEQSRRYGQEIENIKRILEQSRQSSIKKLQQYENKFKIHEEKDAEYKKKQQSYQEKMKTITEQLKKLEIKVKQSQSIIETKTKQQKTIKQSTKNTISKIQKMFGNKQKLLKKSFTYQLNNLRKANEQLKVYINKQLVRFYQQIRMDLILNQINQNIRPKPIQTKKNKFENQKQGYESKSSLVYKVSL